MPTTGAPVAGSDSGRLLRSNVSVAVGTGLSRITGFGRIAAIGAVLGQARLTDTYNFANNTPNVIYELLLGGVLTASLVPMFVQQFEEGDDEATSAVVSVAVVALVALTAVAIVSAPLIVHLYTLKVSDPAMVRSVGTRLARLFLPQIFFYGLIALATALLNARRRFRGPAFAPILNNLLVIVVILLLPKLLSGPLDLANADSSSSLVLLLGFGTTAGIAVTALVMLPMLRRAGIRLRWNPRVGHPAVKRVARISGWTLGYVAANQVAFLVVTILALGGNPGDQSAYINAFTFFVLPHGLLAVSIMTTFAPELATSVNRGNMASFTSQMRLGLRALGLLVIPASAGYLVLAGPLVATGLQRRELTAVQAALTGRVLMAFAAGLFGFSAYLFVLRGFYALRDAKTPFILNIGENAVNVILAVVFVRKWGVVGLGAAYAVAYLSSAVLAYVVLARQVGGMRTQSLMITLGRYVGSAAVMALAVHLAVGGMDNFRLASLIGVILGAVVYLAMVLITGPVEQAVRTALSPAARRGDRDE